MEYVALVLLGLVVYGFSSAAQAISGFGLAVIGVPVLIPFIGVVPAVVSSVLVSIPLCARAWWRERDEVDIRMTERVSVGALFGLPLGLFLLTALPERQLALGIAGAVVVCVLLLGTVKLPPLGAWGQRAGGFVSGAMLTSTGLNGPPLVIAVQTAGLEPRPFRATLQANFLFQDLIGVIGFVVLAKLDLTAALVGLGGALAAPFGWAAGDRVFSGLNPKVFRRIVLAGLLVTAVVSVVTVGH